MTTLFRPKMEQELCTWPPAYGEDDYRICREVNIPLIDSLDEDCKFTSRVPDYAGQFCKDADKAIIRALKDAGKLVHQSTIQHSYPFCERTDTPLIYRAIDAWYVRVEDLRERMLKHNATIHWTPDHVGEKRFANWLADAKGLEHFAESILGFVHSGLGECGR